MNDDREHTLFKLLCRLSNKTSVDCAHGIVYVTASMNNGDTELNLDARWKFSYLSDLVRGQLAGSDLIVKLSADTFAVISNASSDERLTLLIRSIDKFARQQKPKNNSWKVSIGAALFDQTCTTIPELINKMGEYAFLSRSENRIVYGNLTKIGTAQTAIVNQAA